MADEDETRDERARRLREEIARLRSGEGSEGRPKSPREFVDRAAREEKQAQEDDERKGEES